MGYDFYKIGQRLTMNSIKFVLPLHVLAIVPLVGMSWTELVRGAQIDFNRDIRPILSENCFRCHGPDAKQRKAELRLDLPGEVNKPAASGQVPITPGDPDASQIIARIVSADDDQRMPPPETKKSLSLKQRELLRQWIREGAKYARHWSFISPQKAELPRVSQLNWVRNELDRFVLARLDAEGLRPSAEADRAVIIRRLSLDLTGLPPSSDEVAKFVKDPDPQAYSRLVDRLLKSPHFGERLTLDWLDAARYADTNGFSIDGGRHIWLWRDWIIKAFNDNMPYRQFLLEQLAGDLLPNATPEQFIATGFQRNNMVTHEGGTIPEENLTNYNADRVKTMGEAILGLTLGCVQCHDHKYDPFTQKDYYQLFAYFNMVSDIGLDGNSGRNARPTLLAKSVLRSDAEELEVRRQLDKHRKELATPDPAKFAAWQDSETKTLSERGRGFKLHPVKLLKVSTPNRGTGFEVIDNLVRVTEPSDLVAYDVLLQLPEISEPITGVRVVFHPDPKLPGGGWGYGPQSRRPRGRSAGSTDKKDGDSNSKGNFVLTALSVSADAAPGDQVNLHRLLGISRVTANTWQESYPPEQCLDMRNENGWSPELSFDGPVRLTGTFASPVAANSTPFLTVQLNFGQGQNMVASRMEIFVTTGTDDDTRLPAEIVQILESKADERTPKDIRQLEAYYAQQSEHARPLRVAIANLEERLAVLTQDFPTMVMDVAEKPRETFILRRGDYSQRGDKVQAGTPAELPPLAPGSPSNRLGLAQWVTSTQNPLTARVAVNRIWQILFGAGIVRTTADFGTQGDFPSHPELLDWLAVDFMESDWDVKRLITKIVSSATYRQSSAATPELIERDPANRLLARGPRFRLPAELIRDSALKVSGLLVPRLGGPSVNPYTPGDPWREISHYGSTPATAQTFVQDHGEKLYRRSMYTFWKRTSPPANMVLFDAPNRETCVVSRPTTTTPLQALALLNDVQFVEAARAFAERIAARKDATDTERLKWAFAECVSRSPSDQELAILQRALVRERARYQNNEKAARDYVSNGESGRNEDLPPGEHAAWAQVATMLLNLSETVTRN